MAYVLSALFLSTCNFPTYFSSTCFFPACIFPTWTFSVCFFPIFPLSAVLHPFAVELLLWAFSLSFGGYFAFRYVSLKHALRGLNRDLCEIQADITKNRILHLPLPQKELE